MLTSRHNAQIGSRTGFPLTQNGCRALPLQGRVRLHEPPVAGAPHPCEARVGLFARSIQRPLLVKPAFLLLVFILSCASAFTQQPHEASLPVGSAIVGEVKGSVTVVSPQGTPIRFERGQLLNSGSVIETAKGSIVLNLQDGSQILVRANSRVVLQSPPDSATQYLELILGKIWAKVQKRFSDAPSFRMGTPSAVITVRGTEFTVELTRKNETYVYVTEGTVEVAQRGAENNSVLLPPGYFTRVQPNHPPDPPRQHVPNDQNGTDNLRTGRGPGYSPPNTGPATTPGRQAGASEGEGHEGAPPTKPPSGPD